MASEKSLENRIAVLEKLVGRLLLLADGEIEKSSDGDELIHPPPASGSQVNWAAVACVLSNEMDYYCGACPADQKGTWDYVVSGPLSASYCAKYCESKGAECWLRWAIMEAKKCQSSG